MAVDAKAAAARDATSVHKLMKTKYDERQANGYLPGCRERKVEKFMQKSVLSVPTPAGLKASNGDEWFHFQGNPLVRVLSNGKKRILRPMTIPEDGACLTLRQILVWAHAESLGERRRKANISHELAHKFMGILRGAGARILDEGKGNANYFVLEVDGKTVAVSPFGSQEEWWEKPSEGFRSMVTRRGCDWGVVLFLLSEHEGLWIEGSDFDATVLKGKEKVNSGDVWQARRKGLVRPFSKASDFLHLVETPVTRSGKPFLVRKPARD